MRKRFALPALILAALVGACVLFAGCTPAAGPEPEPVVVQVPEPTFTTTNLFSCGTAHVRMADASVAADRVDKSGVLLENVNGAKEYTGTINAKFEGNTAISFGFRRGAPSSYRRFTFTVNSLRRSESFRVIYESTADPSWTGEVAAAEGEDARGSSGVYVQWGDEKRSSRYYSWDGPFQDPNDKNYRMNNDNLNMHDALASPMFGGSGKEEGDLVDGKEYGFGLLYGTLYLEWTASGVLEISVSERWHRESPRLIAAFDGTIDGMGYDLETGSWGLPRMDIDDGYTINFTVETFGGLKEGEQRVAPDVYFYELKSGVRGQERTYPLSAAKIDEPPFYQAM